MYRLLLPLIVLVVMAMVAVGVASLGGDKDTAEKSQASLMSADLRDEKAHPVSLTPWQGKFLVVNFWATWCAPCREEVPALSRIFRKFATKNLQVVGIALDKPENVAQFAKEINITYPIFFSPSNSFEMIEKLGNGRKILPFTVIFETNGRIFARIYGPIDEEALSKKIAQHLQNASK